MIKKHSTYKCPVCGNEVKEKPGKTIQCSTDHVNMKEIKKGIITK